MVRRFCVTEIFTTRKQGSCTNLNCIRPRGEHASVSESFLVYVHVQMGRSNHTSIVIIRTPSYTDTQYCVLAQGLWQTNPSSSDLRDVWSWFTNEFYTPWNTLNNYTNAPRCTTWHSKLTVHMDPEKYVSTPRPTEWNHQFLFWKVGISRWIDDDVTIGENRGMYYFMDQHMDPDWPDLDQLGSEIICVK